MIGSPSIPSSAMVGESWVAAPRLPAPGATVTAICSSLPGERMSWWTRCFRRGMRRRSFRSSARRAASSPTGAVARPPLAPARSRQTRRWPRKFVDYSSPSSFGGSMVDVSSLDFEKGNGRITVVAQDARTAEVLMVAHADREAVTKTIETGQMHYFSRTRGLWRKGATSGNTQKVVSLARDCDGDALLATVLPAGPACHEGKRSCFGSAFRVDPLTTLDVVISERAASEPPPSSAGNEPGERPPVDPSYTRRL